MSYVRRFRQHVPFYKTQSVDDRSEWHHNRFLCDPNCVVGIPIVDGQFIMWAIEDDAPVDTILDFRNGGNSLLRLCCVSEDLDADPCEALDVENIQDEVVMLQENCIIDGVAVQFNYARWKFSKNANCGLFYFKLIAYNGTPQERIFYSEPIHVYESTKRLYKLNINDACGVGGIQWANIWEGWPTIDGYEVFLPDLTEAAFVDEVSDEEVEEDGIGNEIQVFESKAWRYQFDTVHVPEHFAEIIAELSLTDDNAITFPDREKDHYVKICRVEDIHTSDEDGCHVIVNCVFQINRYSKDNCCDVDPCECPQDDWIEPISYTIDQVAAEAANPEIGDIYLVPFDSIGAQWAAQQNNIATWDGNDWTFVPNDRNLIANVLDDTVHVSRGTSSIWEPFYMFIESVTDDVSPDCTWTVVSVLPIGVWAKLQFRVSPAGPWMDSAPTAVAVPGVYHSHIDWNAGITHFTGAMNTYNLRLIALDTGCNIGPSNIETYVQTENCV